MHLQLQQAAIVERVGSMAGTAHYSTGRSKILFLLFVSMLLFMFAKNISSSRMVTIDRFEYWALGLAAPCAAYLLTKYQTRLQSDRIVMWTRILTIWMLCLLLYVIFQISYFAEGFEIPIQSKLGFATPLSLFAISGIYATLAALPGIASFLISRTGYALVTFSQSLKHVGENFLFVWLLFFILVFLS